LILPSLYEIKLQNMSVLSLKSRIERLSVNPGACDYNLFISENPFVDQGGDVPLVEGMRPIHYSRQFFP